MIRAEFRSAGIGAALLRVTEDEIRQAGHQRVTLLCMVGNEGARRFYERHGWRWLGEVEIQVPLGADRMKQTRWQMEKALKA
jgi:ribosomal protein S18 acetylase RimI-like enzyme